jgi:hypothetical protein
VSPYTRYTGALIVDIFPDKPGTAAASKSITRCTLAELLVTLPDHLVKALGYSWVFALLGPVDASTLHPCCGGAQPMGGQLYGREWCGRESERPEDGSSASVGSSSDDETRVRGSELLSFVRNGSVKVTRKDGGGLATELNFGRDSEYWSSSTVLLKA